MKKKKTPQIKYVLIRDFFFFFTQWFVVSVLIHLSSPWKNLLDIKIRREEEMVKNKEAIIEIIGFNEKISEWEIWGILVEILQK